MLILFKTIINITYDIYEFIHYLHYLIPLIHLFIFLY